MKPAAALTEQLQGAINIRIVIEQAKGALARTRSGNVEKAFELMRTYARTNDRRLSDIGQTVITDAASVAHLTYT